MGYGPFPQEHPYVPEMSYTFSSYSNPMKTLGYPEKTAFLVYLSGLFFIPSGIVVYLLDWALQFPVAAYPHSLPYPTMKVQV